MEPYLSFEEINELYSSLNEVTQRISRPPFGQESDLNYVCQIFQNTFGYSDVVLAQTDHLDRDYLKIIASSEESNTKIDEGMKAAARKAIIGESIIFYKQNEGDANCMVVISNETIEPFSLLILTADKKIIEKQPPVFLQSLAHSTSAPMLRKRYFEQSIFLNDLAAKYGNCVENVFLPDYEKGYQMKVAQTAVAIVNKMRLLNDKREKIINEVATAGYLQNIGMKRLPEGITHKDGKLSTEEITVMRTHCQLGRESAQKMPNCPPEVINIIFQHHERNDGSGYPLGLPASRINVGAKILAIAGTFVAMTSFRPYRNPTIYPVKDAIENIERDAGKLYDENAVMGLKRCYEENLLSCLN